MSTVSTNESTIKLTHQREADGRVTITTILLATGDTFAEPIWAQEPAERAKYVNKLCADKPGIGTAEKKWIRKEVEKIARATSIDLRFDTCGKINGRASSSARLWSGDKVIETASLNLLGADSRERAIKHLTPFVAGRNAGKRRLEQAERDLRKLFMAELQRVLTAPAIQPRSANRDCPYYDDGRGIVMKTKDGDFALTSFSARIVAVVTRFDGQESKSDFELEVTAGGIPRRVMVKAKEFDEMKWPIELLHDEGYISPERSAAAHARAAIMLFSRNPKPEKKMLYTHTGWLTVSEGVYAYLHAGGAITADPTIKIDVQIHKALSRYVLPPAPEGVGLRSCVRASMKLLDLAPGHVAFPGYCAIWRSVLGPCDCGVFTVGPSGTFKSELTALRVQHFGPGLDRTHLPANWSSTSNSLELLAFSCKDAILVIDDFAPCGSKTAVDALHGAADRVFRAQGNNSGRQRTSKDAEVGDAKPPRGMIIASGEDLPRGQSLRARLMAEELSPGDIAPAKLAECQRDAREGLYAGAMSGFIRWLCDRGRIGAVQKGLRARVDELRDQAVRSGVHRRTPEVVANLAVGMLHFIEFAMDLDVITREEGDALWARTWEQLGEAAERQKGLQGDNEPAARFVQLFASALLSGEAHLTNTDGNRPDEEIAAACGWRRRGETNIWEPQGIWSGCVDGREVFLEFDAAYRAAQRAAGGSDGLVIAATTLRKRLQEKGLLQGADSKRTAVRKRVKGALRMMVWLAPGALGGHFARTARTEPRDDDEFPFADSETGVKP